MRHYPPAYADKKTIAYLLSCDVSEVDDLVEKKIIPGPYRIGDLLRWKVEHVLIDLEHGYEVEMQMWRPDGWDDSEIPTQ